MEIIKPSDEKAWDIKEGDFVVSHYFLNEYWDDWDPTLANCALYSKEQYEKMDKFPVLLGVVTKCEYKKYFCVFYFICDKNGAMLHANIMNNSYEDNYWFKYDFEKLGIDKEWFIENLEYTIKEKETELKNFNYFKNAFYKNEKGG